MLKKFTELEIHERGAACQEYPGTWLVIADHGYEATHPTLEDAKNDAILQNAEQTLKGNNNAVRICWGASDGDPRIGQYWFTGYYQHGYFVWGNYVKL